MEFIAMCAKTLCKEIYIPDTHLMSSYPDYEKINGKYLENDVSKIYIFTKYPGSQV